MSYIKCVDGVMVEMTPEEILELEESRRLVNTPPDWDALDTHELNLVLSQNGSVVRALAELTFEQINVLRQRASLSTFTKEQFMTALKAKMRN